MARSYFFVASICLFSLLAGCGGGTVFVRDPAPIYVPDARGRAEIRAAILASLGRHHWRPETEAQDRVVAVLYVRSHVAKVLVTYDDRNVWLQYLDSAQLDYHLDMHGRPRIHPNYNRWVQNLANDIGAALSAAPVQVVVSGPTPTGSASSATSAAPTNVIQFNQ